MATTGQSASLAVSGNVGQAAGGTFSATGNASSQTGDALYIDAVQPAWPQSKPVVLIDGTGDVLLVQLGFLTVGASAADPV